MPPVLQSIITCPVCGFREERTMPTDACQYFHVCKSCGRRLRPNAGDCCIFCSYGNIPCPPVQQAREQGEDRGGCA